MMHNNTERRLARVCLALFFAFLVWALYFKFGLVKLVRLNFYPYTTLDRRLKLALRLTLSGAMRDPDVLENIIVTAPLGVLLPIAHDKVRIGKHLLTCFLFSLSIEVAQLFSAIGGMTLLDLICNTAGYFVGLAFYVGLFVRLPERVRTMALSCATTLTSACVTFAYLQLIHLLPDYIDMISTWIHIQWG